MWHNIRNVNNYANRAFLDLTEKCNDPLILWIHDFFEVYLFFCRASFLLLTSAIPFCLGFSLVDFL